jgi:hypothetical protein
MAGALVLNSISAFGNAEAARFGYISNEKSGIITVIDTTDVGELPWVSRSVEHQLRVSRFETTVSFCCATYGT